MEDVVARPTRSQRRDTAIEDKESIRWIEGLSVAQSIAMAQPEVRMICLADSEADIYEYLSQKGMVQNSLLPVNGSQPGPSSNEVNPCRPTHQL